MADWGIPNPELNRLAKLYWNELKRGDYTFHNRPTVVVKKTPTAPIRIPTTNSSGVVCIYAETAEFVRRRGICYNVNWGPHMVSDHKMSESELIAKLGSVEAFNMLLTSDPRPIRGDGLKTSSR